MKKYQRPLNKAHRRHFKIGSQKVKSIAIKDITDYCRESNSIFTKNYIHNEWQIWQLLKYANTYISINTNKL